MLPTPAPTTPPASQMNEEVLAEAPRNFGTIPFSILATLFERLQSERKQDKRRKYIENWFQNWREKVGYDLYPALRLILPYKDRERAVYGLKEKNLAKIYINLIGLTKRDPDGIRLTNWKRPTGHDTSSGDFPTVLYEVVNARSSVTQGTLTVDELNETLDDLAKNHKNSEAQTHILKKIYNNATASEQRWIVRTILKDMTISVKETTVFSVFHPDAQDLFNTCSDLKKVAWDLWDKSHRLNEADTTIQLFSAFAPMLCKRPLRRIEDTIKEMGGETFIIEEKLDGERMQMHKRGNEYFYCSRKGKDYTHLYGKHRGTGSLTPFIDEAFDQQIESIILDGEMLVWDPISERNLPFGTLKTAALDKSKKEFNPRPCFKVFDLLYLNGKPVLHKNTRSRKAALHRWITPITGRIEFTIEFEGKGAKDIRERMDQIMAERGEGLVIKHPKSQYVLNGRNKDWIKVKPEYMDNLGETVDVLVVAGNYGTGKRSGGVSTLICAVVEDRGGEDIDPDGELVYTTFVRVGSGLTYADYMWIRNKPWKERDPKNPPSFIRAAKTGLDDKGDLYLEPEDSFILKVKAAEITATAQYGMGYTMRFPRAMAVRGDLTLSDCMTASAVMESLRTLKKRKMESDVVQTKKKRKTQVKKPTIVASFQNSGVKAIKAESDLFDGFRFKVLDPKTKNGAEEQKELAQLIVSHGGKTALTVSKPQPNTFVVYGGSSIHFAIREYMNHGIDILKPQWIHDSIEQGDLMPFRKKYFFFANPDREISEEYFAEEDEEPMKDDAPKVLKRRVTPRGDTPSQQLPEDKEEPNVNPAFADWFKIPEDRKQASADDSVTEDESDADSINEEHRTGPPLTDEFAVEDDAEVEYEEDVKMEDIKMGEDDNAMEYDTEKIFRHLCFYLDTPTNARMAGLHMEKSATEQAAIEEKMKEIADMIISNGGRVTTSFKEPKLTHVLFDRRDVSRVLDIRERTAIPKRRHLIITDWVEVCLDENSLIDEDDFKA